MRNFDKNSTKKHDLYIASYKVDFNQNFASWAVRKNFCFGLNTD